MNPMLNELKPLFTDKEDNIELTSIVTCIIAIAFLYFSYEAYVVFKQTFSPESFGMGAGAIGCGQGIGKMMGNKGDYGQ